MKTWQLAVLLVIVIGCGKSPIKDLDGRILPRVGTEAELIEKHGWIAVSEAAMQELIRPPTASLSMEKALMERALEENAHRLIQAGQIFQVAPGTKLRILKYFNGELNPTRNGDALAFFVQVEILDGAAKSKTGFTTADGVN